MTNCFQVNPTDNVATVLDDTPAGRVNVVGGGQLVARVPINLGHKIALAQVPVGGAILKYGVRIGHATQPIQPGDWVHLHNLASDFDERSSTALDVASGAPRDTRYE